MIYYHELYDYTVSFCYICSLLWNFISSLIEIIELIYKNLEDIPMTTYREIKELLINPSWKYLHKNPYHKEGGEIQVEINIASVSPQPSIKDVCTLAGNVSQILFWLSQ